MLMELGRGPLDFKLIEVKTALDEVILDLPLGSRGFHLQERSRTAVLRISNIKGEVTKATDADPKPKFWTIRAGNRFVVTGIRVMRVDANEPDGTPFEQDDIPDGQVLEQRYYLTSESDATDIEVLIRPGH